MSYTDDIAEYVTATRFEALPGPVVTAAKRITLDLLGVIFPAKLYGPATAMNAYVRRTGGAQRATVVATDIRTSAGAAALANGTMAAEMEQDDVHSTGTHPSSVYVPALLGVAEGAGSSGTDWITALVCAYDVGIRLNTAMGLANVYSRGFHPTSVGGSFGATAGAARLLGLDRDAVVSAIGLNGCQAAGLLTWEMEPEHYAKSFQSGMAARNAVTAVELAAGGYIGAPDTLDGRYNVFDTFTTHRNFAPLTDALGERWEILRTTYKFYSCCRAIHTTLDIVLDMVAEHGFTAADVASLTVSLTPDIAPLVDDNVLNTHNLQHVVAAALIDGEVTRAQTTPQRRADPVVADLAKRIELVHDAALAARHPDSGIIDPARATVRLHDGREFTDERDSAQGGLTRPVTDEQIEAKFVRMATQVISSARAEEIVSCVRELETLTDIRQLTALLSIG
jgi:2-methylcitrate dehydratase PrpD